MFLSLDIVSFVVRHASCLLFKVYVVRKNGSEGVDVTIGLLKLDASVKQLNNDAVHVENLSVVVRYAVDFKEVRSSEDFNILVNGSVINSELSKHLQIKYDHELCSSRKCFLRDHIIEDLNCKLIGGMLAETINIADGIRAPTFTTFQENFPAWEKTLKAFQGLGMNVSFFLARLKQLRKLSAKWKRR
ncbi:hypothetical protein POTOM_021299 [Populus tomentosa]|uniref:Uncharacterized protein n=1 Tax=Populus tomentosa TaxID=118781 RepID=A0A8X7ZQ77_POPTO|nr:hypothetical protein POTOM_021299 [Populus tomentosa]